MILFHIFIFSKYVYLLPFNFTFPNLFIIFICLYSLSFSAQIKTDSPFPVLSVFGDPGEIRTPDTLIRSQVLYPAELLGHVAGAEGLKPPTYGFGDRCSINCAMPLYPYVTVP